jgi:pimeloyl-ACP methyl ester carboxylesterase
VKTDQTRFQILTACAAAAAAAAAGVAAFKISTRYQREMRSIRVRLNQGSQVFDTPHGPIETAIQGEGPVVLSIHGSVGGYDQGLLLGNAIFGSDCRLVAPSRFGFLRTPYPASSLDIIQLPSAQADACASLLDVLKIERVVVIGFSAGGPATLQFALRHPDRTAGVILASAASWAPIAPESTRHFPLPQQVYDAILRSDFLLWAGMTFALPQIESAFGVTPELQARLTPDDRQLLKDFFYAMLPLSLRQEGVKRDGPMVNALAPYPIEELKAPVLILHARDDQIAPIGWAEYNAVHIPNVESLFFDQGGHTLIGNYPVIRQRVKDFMQRISQSSQT